MSNYIRVECPKCGKLRTHLSKRRGHKVLCGLCSPDIEDDFELERIRKDIMKGGRE